MKKVYTLTVYRAADGWRWRLTAKNGLIVADSGEAYARKRNALRSARSLADARILLTVNEAE